LLNNIHLPHNYVRVCVRSFLLGSVCVCVCVFLPREIVALKLIHSEHNCEDINYQEV